MKQESPPIHLDIKAFTQSSGHIAGSDLLSNYERLKQELQDSAPNLTLDWSASGEVKSNEAESEQVWLHLAIDACLPMTCQRCLSPVNVDIAVQRSFRFVENEEIAEAEDEEAEEDVLALSRDFNLAELIEDEILMELPVVPRHDQCPVEVKLAVEDPGFEIASTEKKNPFAVLAKLQVGKKD
jgi:uncharacterized protein